MRLLLSTCGAAGAALVLAFGFVSADADGDVSAAPEPRNVDGFVIVGHGGGLGACGMPKEPLAKGGGGARRC